MDDRRIIFLFLLVLFKNKEIIISRIEITGIETLSISLSKVKNKKPQSPIHSINHSGLFSNIFIAYPSLVFFGESHRRSLGYNKIKCRGYNCKINSFGIKDFAINANGLRLLKFHFKVLVLYISYKFLCALLINVGTILV